MRPVLVLLVVLLAAGAWWALGDRTPPPRAGATPTKADEAPPQPREKPPPTRRLAGKVTGDAPLGDVRILAEWEGGAGEGRTRDDGAYEIADPGDGVVRLRAEAPDGRVGFAKAESGTAPDIALKAAAGVTFATEPAIAGARLEIGHGKDPDWFWPFATARTGADGTATLRLPLGDLALQGFAEGFGRASVAFKVEGGAQRVVVPLPAERNLVVTVIEKGKEAPVAGARLLVYASSGAPYGVPEAVTDAKGVAPVRGLDAGDRIAILAVPPGEVPQEDRGSFRRRQHVPEGVTELTIEIGLPRAIVWEVLVGDIPPPDEGTVVPLRALPGASVTPPPTGVMRGGRLVAEGWPFEASGVAEALGPRGTVARLWCAPEALVGEPTKFELSRALVVTLKRPGGEAAAGASVALFNGGNNLIRQAAAGEDGIARMEQLAAEVADLFVIGNGQYDRREVIGTVDLRKGDVAVTHTLTPEKRWEVTLLLDGKPFLPPCALQVGGQYQTGSDAEHGRLTGSFVPRGPRTWLFLNAAGFRKVSEEVDVPLGDAPLLHTITLDKGFECRVRIVGEQPERLPLDLQQASAQGWHTIDAPNRGQTVARREAEDGWIYTGLDAGRYRIRTLREGILWGPVEVGGGTAEIVIDFTRMTRIRGRVEVPAGYGFEDVQLELRGDGVAEEESQFRPGFPVNREDGSFDVPIPGDRQVRLRARHHVLSCPAPIETTAGLEGAVLKLVEGPTLSFRLPGWEAAYAKFLASMPDWQRPGVRVVLRREGTTVFDLVALAKDDVWRAGGFEPGRYDVWIDVPEAMPLLLKDRDLKAGTNDLGEIPSLPGSRVRLRVLVKDGLAAPTLWVGAHHLGEPAYYRNMGTGGGRSEAVLQGLGAGRFRVSVTGLTAERGLLKEVDLDGANEVELTLDLR